MNDDYISLSIIAVLAWALTFKPHVNIFATCMLRKAYVIILRCMCLRRAAAREGGDGALPDLVGGWAGEPAKWAFLQTKLKGGRHLQKPTILLLKKIKKI